MRNESNKRVNAIVCQRTVDRLSFVFELEIRNANVQQNFLSKNLLIKLLKAAIRLITSENCTTEDLFRNT